MHWQEAMSQSCFGEAYRTTKEGNLWLVKWNGSCSTVIKGKLQELPNSEWYGYGDWQPINEIEKRLTHER